MELLTDPLLRQGLPDGLRRTLLAIPRGGDRPGRRHVARATPEPAGTVRVRGAGASVSHQLYKVGGYEVDFFIDSGALLGQVLASGAPGASTDWSGAHAYFYGERGVLTCPVGADGELQLSAFADGTYDLVVESADVTLVLKGVPLQGGSADG